MEGNFLSRYNNRIEEWNTSIRKDPSNRKRYESEMAEYIMKCMPYLDQHVDDGDEKTNTDNIFNVKETVGLQRKDIFTDYLIDVEKKNIAKPQQRTMDVC